MTDPYLTDNGTLRNNFGVIDPEDLQRIESDYTKFRLHELVNLEQPLGQFDLAHFRAVHQHIFQDVYPWAGFTRADQINIDGVVFTSPPLLSKGKTTFAVAIQVNQRLERALEGIAGKGFKGLSRLEFTQNAANLLATLNAIHPFREGNGRTQRAFINDLARDAGYFLDWSVVSQERMIAVSIASMNDPSAMRRLLEEIVDPTKVTALKNAIHFLDQNQINWNERYLANTTPGVQYSGVVAASSKKDVILFTQDHQIMIARAQDVPRDSDSEEVNFTAT